MYRIYLSWLSVRTESNHKNILVNSLKLIIAFEQVDLIQKVEPLDLFGMQVHQIHSMLTLERGLKYGVPIGRTQEIH